jgi:hypothetical protein
MDKIQAQLEQFREIIDEWASQCCGDDSEDDEPHYTLTTILYPHESETAKTTRNRWFILLTLGILNA